MISVECPKCKTVAQVPDSAEGARGKCAVCGAEVHVPGAAIKKCATCGKDVTQARRTRDDQGRYQCVDCYRADAARENAAEPLNACTACGGKFRTADLLYNGGNPICRSCLAETQQKRRQQQASPQGPVEVKCRICGGMFAAKDMFNNAGQLICHSCYMEMFTGGGDPSGSRAATEPKAAAKPLWQRLRNKIAGGPGKCPACGKTGAAIPDPNKQPGWWQCQACGHQWEHAGEG